LVKIPMATPYLQGIRYCAEPAHLKKGTELTCTIALDALSSVLSVTAGE
jgi:hypothetical protein